MIAEITAFADDLPWTALLHDPERIVQKGDVRPLAGPVGKVRDDPAIASCNSLSVSGEVTLESSSSMAFLSGRGDVGVTYVGPLEVMLQLRQAGWLELHPGLHWDADSVGLVDCRKQFLTAHTKYIQSGGIQ